MVETGALFECLEAEIRPGRPLPDSARVVFKPSHRGEWCLLPPSLDELIGSGNLVRFVDAVVDRLDLSELIRDIFTETVSFAFRAGMVRSGEVHVDHTKVEANSNRHRVVWCKSVEKYLSRAASGDRLVYATDSG